MDKKTNLVRLSQLAVVSKRQHETGKSKSRSSKRTNIFRLVLNAENRIKNKCTQIAKTYQREVTKRLDANFRDRGAGGGGARIPQIFVEL